MGDRYAVKITLISQKKPCHNGHKVGDEWIVKRHTPEGICLGAFSTILPCATALQFGGNLPWEPEPGIGHLACPDPEIVNVFRMERLEKI